MDASTTAAFASAGVSASSVYSLMQYVFGTGLSVALWLIKAAVPFLFVLAAIGVLLSIGFSIFRFFRRAH